MNTSFFRKNTVCLVMITLFLCISLLLLLYTLFIPPINESSEKKEWIYIYVSNDETETVSESETTEESGWVLRIYGDRIGIFREDGSLFDVLDVQIKTLPKADITLLEEGIYAPDKETLDALIEDYSE